MNPRDYLGKDVLKGVVTLLITSHFGRWVLLHLHKTRKMLRHSGFEVDPFWDVLGLGKKKLPVSRQGECNIKTKQKRV